MWARYDTATRRLKYWSTVPFTVDPASDEADKEFPGDEKNWPLPKGPQLRLSDNLTWIEIDPEYVPPVPQREIDLADVQSKINTVLKQAKLDPDLLAALAALRKVL